MTADPIVAQPSPLEQLTDFARTTAHNRRAKFEADAAQKVEDLRSSLSAFFTSILPGDLRDMFDWQVKVETIAYEECRHSGRLIKNSWISMRLKGQPEDTQVILHVNQVKDTLEVTTDMFFMTQPPLSTVILSTDLPDTVTYKIAGLVTLYTQQVKAGRQERAQRDREANAHLDQEQRINVHSRQKPNEAWDVAKERAWGKARVIIQQAYDAEYERYGWKEGTVLKLWKIEWCMGINNENEPIIVVHYADHDQPVDEYFHVLNENGWTRVRLQGVYGYQATELVITSVDDLPEYWMRSSFYHSVSMREIAVVPCSCGLPTCPGTVENDYQGNVHSTDLGIGSQLVTDGIAQLLESQRS